MAARNARRPRGRPSGGSEAIVRTILDATLRQLEERGFAGVSVEEIARAAGVNKTSVYRRWPSKAELVLAAVRATRATEPAFVETDDLQKDLVRLLKAKVARLASPAGHRIAHALMTLEGGDRVDLTSVLRERRDHALRELLQRAVLRGDLPVGTDAAFMSELLVAPYWNRLFIRDEPVDARFLTKVVDRVLAGFGYGRSKR